MFNRNGKSEAPQRRLVLCASSSEDMLRKLLMQIDVSVAEAVAVQTQVQLFELIEERVGDIDDLILCSDFTDERSLEKLVREIPQSIIIFMIRNRTVNTHILSKIHAEGVEQVEVEDIAGLYGKQVAEEEEEAEQKSKSRFLNKLPKLPNKAEKKDLSKASNKNEEAFDSQEDASEQNEGAADKTPQKKKRKPRIGAKKQVKEAESKADTHRTSDAVTPDGVIPIVRKIALGSLTKGRTETDQGPRVREIKTVEQKLVYTKQVSTKVTRASNKKYRIAVTGMARSGKSTFALALTHEIARRKEKAALVDLDYESKTPLSRLLGAPDTEDGLLKLLDDQTDPLSIDKSDLAGLYTSADVQQFESLDILQMLSALDQAGENSVVDIPVKGLDAVQHYDRIVFVMDSDPVLLDLQMEILLDVVALRCAPVTVVLNKHTKSCLDRRTFRKQINGRMKSYFNDLYICPFNVEDFDYLRSHVRGGFDGSKLNSAAKTAESIVNSLFV